MNYVLQWLDANEFFIMCFVPLLRNFFLLFPKRRVMVFYKPASCLIILKSLCLLSNVANTHALRPVKCTECEGSIQNEYFYAKHSLGSHTYICTYEEYWRPITCWLQSKYVNEPLGACRHLHLCEYECVWVCFWALVAV